MNHMNSAQKIIASAKEHGYEDAAIIPVSALSGYKDKLRERKEKAPESAPVLQNLVSLANPTENFPWAKTVLVCLDWFGGYRYPEKLTGKYAKSYLLSADSPISPEECQKRLEFEAWLTDEGIRWAGGEQGSPVGFVPLRYAAVMSGLGIIRKNNFFYTEKGSSYKLKAYLLDIEDTCLSERAKSIRPCSDKCNLCQKSCTAKAITGPYTMNALRCTSFLTSFGGGRAPEAMEDSQMGHWVFGCDNCQNACPYNRHDWTKGDEHKGLSELVDFLQPEKIVEASDEELIEKVVPLLGNRITPEKVDTLRVSARRVLSLM